MSRPTPRRPSSTRAGTSRPRRLAGQRAGGEPAPADSPAATDAAAAAADAPATVGADTDTDGGADATTGGGRLGGLLAGERATRFLIGTLAVLVVLGLLQLAWFVRHTYFADEPTAQVKEGEIAVPSGRPVVMSAVAVKEGVDAAAEAAQVIVARTHQNYDAEVDEATRLMTPSFAEKYRQITSDVRPEFVKNKTRVDARVVGQAVVRANQTQLQAMVFLNQYTTKGAAKNPVSTYAPYRALLTMVHTDDGWLVEDIQTK